MVNLATSSALPSTGSANLPSAPLSARQSMSNQSA